MALHAAPSAPAAAAALRTAFKVGFPAFIVALAVAPQVIQIILDCYGLMLPEGVRAWLLGAAAVITATAAIVARIRAVAAAAAAVESAAQPDPAAK